MHGYGRLIYDGNIKEGLWEEAGFYDSKTPKNVKEVTMYNPMTNPIARAVKFDKYELKADEGNKELWN